MTKRKAYIEEIDKLTLDEVKERRKELQAHSKFYKEKLEVLDNKIKEFQDINRILSPDKHIDDIKTVELIIERMRAYSDDNIPFNECDECIKWIQKKIAKIVSKSDELIKIAHNNPGTISLINSTYDIYAEEMMSIILNYQEAVEEQQEKMEPQLRNLLDAFYNKLDRLFQKIYDSKEFALGVDIDYLTKRLNEDLEDAERKDGDKETVPEETQNTIETIETEETGEESES